MSDTTQAGDPGLESRRKRAAGRLLDDESLRGGLTDDEFKPLLDWALDVMDRVVLSTDGEDDQRVDNAIGTAGEEIAELLRQADVAIQAHRDGRVADRREALMTIGRILHGQYRRGGSTQDDRRRPLEQLAVRLDAEPDLDTSTLATELVRAMIGPTPRRRGAARR
jgi:hypothetical protein